MTTTSSAGAVSAHSALGQDELVSVRDMRVHFPIHAGVMLRRVGEVKDLIVDAVDRRAQRREIV